eukprot:TRINITY_DN5854_c0_g1_i2.p1 TRINITY_DN5854_c0_g1~~TRINITY_DN5854_c0_g1_i2.p1  ORF type:complete len:935 (+),score=159.23 TRINITY_DN5854_c0_g1_i2:85-2805(+)
MAAAAPEHADPGEESDGDDASSLSSCEDFACVPGGPGGTAITRKWLQKRKSIAAGAEAGITQEELGMAKALLRFLVPPQQPPGSAGAAPSLGGAAVVTATAGNPRSTVRRSVRQRVREAALQVKHNHDPRAALAPLMGAQGLGRALTDLSQHNLAATGTSAPRRAVGRLAGAADRSIGEQAIKAHRDLSARVASELRSLLIQAGEDDPVATAEQRKERLDRLATAANDAGHAKRAEHDLHGALTSFKELLRLRLEGWGPDHAHTALARSYVATILRDLGDMDGALNELREALRIQIQAHGAEHPHVAVARSNLGAVLKHQGQPDMALAQHMQALQILLQHHKSERHAFVAEVREHIAHALRLLGAIKLSVDEYQKALAIREEVLGADHPKTLRIVEKISEMDTGWAAPTCMRYSPTLARYEVQHDWDCPSCSHRNIAAACVCAACSYRRPLCKGAVPQIFDGFVFVFTGVIPKCVHPSNWMEWRAAEQRGARVSEELEQGTTHVIFRSGYDRSYKVRLAEAMDGVKIVPLEWFVQSVNSGVAQDATHWDIRNRTNNEQRYKRAEEAKTDGPVRSHSAPCSLPRLQMALVDAAPDDEDLQCSLPEPKPIVSVPPRPSATRGSAKVLVSPRGSNAKLAGVLDPEEAMRMRSAGGDARSGTNTDDAALVSPCSARSDRGRASGVHSPKPIRAGSQQASPASSTQRPAGAPPPEVGLRSGSFVQPELERSADVSVTDIDSAELLAMLSPRRKSGEASFVFGREGTGLPRTMTDAFGGRELTGLPALNSSAFFNVASMSPRVGPVQSMRIVKKLGDNSSEVKGALTSFRHIPGVQRHHTMLGWQNSSTSGDESASLRMVSTARVTTDAGTSTLTHDEDPVRMVSGFTACRVHTTAEPGDCDEVPSGNDRDM